MDRLESMSVFIDIVETGNLAGAAERQGLSPSMIAKHLKALEDRLGVQLLIKTTRSQRLTEAGELFLKTCREILNQVNEAETEVSALQGGPAGLLKISAPISFGVRELSPALKDFMNDQPKIQLELTLTDSPIDPVTHGVDVAFRIGPLADSWLIARPLNPYWMVVCASPHYLETRGTPSHPLDLKEHACLGHTRWGHRHAWHFEGTDGIIDVPLQYKVRIDNGPALREAALAGAGIIMQPKFLVKEDIQAGRLRELLSGFKVNPRQFYIVHAKDRLPQQKLQAFVEFALKRFQADSN